MGEETLRETMAAAIRTVLEEGVRQAADPITYLRAAAEEIRLLVAVVDEDPASDREEGARVRAILAEEVQAIAQEMIRRLRH